MDIDKDTCEANLSWNRSTVDFHLTTDYNVTRYSMRNYDWLFEEMVSVGTVTQYNTGCVLHPGRFYGFNVDQTVSLSDPDQTIYFTASRNIIMGKNWVFSKLH